MCNSAGMSMKNNDLQQAFRLSLPVLGAFPWRTPCQTVTIIYDACKATPADYLKALSKIGYESQKR